MAELILRHFTEYIPTDLVEVWQKATFDSGKLIPLNILPALAWYWRRYWALPYAGSILVWCLVMTGEILWGHVLVDWQHIILALSFGVVLFKQYLYFRK